MNMGTRVVWLHLILMTLTQSVDCLEEDGAEKTPFYSKAVDQDFWPDLALLTGVFFGKPLLEPVGFNELGSSFPVPFHPWNFMDIRAHFTLKVVNSTLNGQTGTNVYKRGELVYLQATSSSSPGQELYLQSCYAAPTPNFNDKSRLVLIINKGCVSSKQSVVKFISRENEAVNFVLDTSSLKFSQIYVHCTVALSGHGLTPDTKSCNYIAEKAKWVELGGQTDVCECCSTKCADPPHYQAPFGEFKAVVSAGPLSIKEQELEKQLLSGRTPIASSQIGASATSNGNHWIMSGASPSGVLPSFREGLIVSGASVSGQSMVNRSPWQTPPVAADLVVGQGVRNALSFLLPGLMLGVQSSPVLEIEVSYPQKRHGAKAMPHQSIAPADLFWTNPAASFEASLQREPWKMIPAVKPRLHELGMVGFPLPDAPADLFRSKPETNIEASLQREDPQLLISAVKPGLQEIVGFPLSDAPDVQSGRHIADIPQPHLESFLDEPEEELRGDVFTNFREPQLEQVSSDKNSLALLNDMPKGDVPDVVKPKEEGDVLVVSHTEILFKKANADVLAKPESLKQSRLTLKGLPVGSSSLDNAEHFNDQEESTKQNTEKLVSSLMALMRKLNKTL